MVCLRRLVDSQDLTRMAPCFFTWALYLLFGSSGNLPGILSEHLHTESSYGEGKKYGKSATVIRLILSDMEAPEMHIYTNMTHTHILLCEFIHTRSICYQ